MELKKVKKGEVLSTTLYMTVVDTLSDGVKVVDTNGQKFDIKGKKLIESTIKSANQYSKEHIVTRTELADILIGAGDSVFTVEFEKQDGSARTLVGRLINTENTMGRSNVVDLQITSGMPNRQVDHRTLQSMILKDNRYVVKGK